MNQEIAASASDGLIALPAIIDLADTYRLSPKAFAYTFRAVAMPQPHTEAEFVSCCLVAKEHGMNPLTKEIYFMRTRQGAIQPIVSVDGWIKKCNEHPQFDGLEFSDDRDAGGKLVSMTVAIYRKDRSRPTKVTEYMAECSASGGPVWKTSPSRMLRNRTICQGARIAFGFAGVMDRDEFDQWQSLRDVTPKPLKTTAAPELPDIPDIPDAQPNGAATPEDSSAVGTPPLPDDDPPIADVDGFLAKLTEDRSFCDCEADVEDMRANNADVIARLKPADQKRARAIIEGDGS